MGKRESGRGGSAEGESGSYRKPARVAFLQGGVHLPQSAELGPRPGRRAACRQGQQPPGASPVSLGGRQPGLPPCQPGAGLHPAQHIAAEQTACCSRWQPPHLESGTGGGGRHPVKRTEQHMPWGRRVNQERHLNRDTDRVKCEGGLKGGGARIAAAKWRGKFSLRTKTTQTSSSESVGGRLRLPVL